MHCSWRQWLKSAVAWSLAVTLLNSHQLVVAQRADSFKVKYVGGYPSVNDKHEGLIRFDNSAQEMVFLKAGKRPLFSIPYDQITVVSADERARRRVKETVILGVTLIGLFALPILFSKKKMRYVLVEFRDPERDTAGAAMFRVKKRHKVGLMVAAAERADLQRQGEDLFAREGQVSAPATGSRTLGWWQPATPDPTASPPSSQEPPSRSPVRGLDSAPTSLAQCLSFDNLQKSILDDSGDYWTVAWRVDVVNGCSETFRVEVVFTAYDERRNRLEEAGLVVAVAAGGITPVETKMAIEAGKARAMALEGVGLRTAP